MKAIIKCRSTGRGAYTSANGRVINESRTGNHWEEVVAGEVGHEFAVINISNSGKHNCFRARLIKSDDPDGDYEVIETAERDCQFCREETEA